MVVQRNDGTADDSELVWGRHRLPSSEATGHFLGVAASGGGKSTLVQLLLQSGLGNAGRTPDLRALIYDAKQNILPLAAAICPHAKVVTSHPYDQRGAAWAISRDVKDPAVALEVAFTLIPSIHESQPFFADAARHLMYGVMLSFILTGKPWTFATLLRVMQSASRIRRVLRRHPQTRAIEKEYFGDERLASNIMSTIATKLLPYGNIAASWETATETFSLEDWCRGNWILVLGNYETGRTAINAVNRCITKRAIDLTLNLPDSFTRRSWFVYDELTEAGKLDGLVSLMKKGRSKGAVCVLAFQSVQGPRDQSSYGPQQADEIFGQIANRFFGRLECVATAEWASSLFGDQEFSEESITESSGAGGTSRSTSRHRASRRLVLPSEFLDLEACNMENGLSGYYIVRSHGSYFDKLEGHELWGNALTSPRSDVPEFLPRPPMSQLLAPWSQSEELSFCAPRHKREKPQEPTISQPPKPDRTSHNLDDLDEHFQ